MFQFKDLEMSLTPVALYKSLSGTIGFLAIEFYGVYLNKSE